MSEHRRHRPFATSPAVIPSRTNPTMTMMDLVGFSIEAISLRPSNPVRMRGDGVTRENIVIHSMGVNHMSRGNGCASSMSRLRPRTPDNSVVV